MESETKDALNVELVKVLQQLLVLRRQPLVMLLLLGASKTALLRCNSELDPKSNDDVVERGIIVGRVLVESERAFIVVYSTLVEGRDDCGAQV
jgi:hypothetical protein